jgi:carbonic anhydrase
MVAVFGLGLAVAASLSGTASGGEEAPALKPEEAIARLRDGNTRYVLGKSTHPRADAARREETVQHGQHPFASVLSCSDSRAPVEQLFDQGIGDLFVVRVAGNVCNADETGSLEYGTDHLGTPLLVVLGHTGCGAVTAVATGAEVHGSVPLLLAGIRPAVSKAQRDNPDLHGKDLVPAAIEANVWQAIEDLLAKSPVVRGRVKGGKLKIVGAVYHLDSGRVKWLGEHPDQRRLLDSRGAPDHGAPAPAKQHAEAAH